MPELTFYILKFIKYKALKPLKVEDHWMMCDMNVWEVIKSEDYEDNDWWQ